mmetsp:Transcript_22979/g.32109  ORF Transcript_22979/g.32109 Transcript_22979/m.32109 type:complete len:98 (-) Transcript_22979:167-460(-)
MPRDRKLKERQGHSKGTGKKVAKGVVLNLKVVEETPEHRVGHLADETEESSDHAISHNYEEDQNAGKNVNVDDSQQENGRGLRICGKEMENETKIFR